MSNPQPQGGQGPAPQQQGVQLKAEDVLKLQCLNENLKQKYRLVAQNLWNNMQNKPTGSEEHNSARQKLQDFSSKLITQERQFRAKLKAQQQANQGQAGQQSQPGQSSQQASQSTNAQQQPTQDQKPPQQQQMQQPPNPAQGARPPQANQQPQIDPEIIKHVSGFKYFLPANGPQEGTLEGNEKIKEMRNNYLMALNRQHKATQKIKMLNNMLEQRQKTGQEASPVLNQKAALEKEYSSAKDFVESFRKKQAQNKAEQEQRRSQQQSQPQPPQQPQQPTAQRQRQPSQPDIKQEPQIKVEGGQMSQAPQTQQFGNMQGGSQQSQLPPQQGAQGPQAGQQPMRQPPVPHSQQTQPPNQHPQFAQPGQPQAHQQPPRPQINPHQANAMQHQQTNSPHPQSASAQGPPVPLSHQAAVSAAQRSYSNPDAQRTATPIQPGGQGSFHIPGGREREPLNNPKMPIPRQLNITAPSPVGMGQARPTMTGPTNGAPGPMGQPVISKFPPFQLEGEGDRVLSKRKLDELVRQVTGGSEEALTPEVEEAVLQLADDFVDTVISNACKLAKLRESTQLDIRDIQLVLERNYNIRIPGYASDEVRTVRRLVPAAGWTQKMNAVQAAKVMGGKTDI